MAILICFFSLKTSSRKKINIPQISQILVITSIFHQEFKQKQRINLSQTSFSV